MSQSQIVEYAALRKAVIFKRFLFWMDKIVAAEKKVQKASVDLVSNIPAKELNSLAPDGNRFFLVDGEKVEHYQHAVSEYCKVHDELFSLLEKLEQKYPAIFLTEEGLSRKLGLIQQREAYLRIIKEFRPAEGVVSSEQINEC